MTTAGAWPNTSKTSISCHMHNGGPLPYPPLRFGPKHLFPLLTMSGGCPETAGAPTLRSSALPVRLRRHPDERYRTRYHLCPRVAPSRAERYPFRNFRPLLGSHIHASLQDSSARTHARPLLRYRVKRRAQLWGPRPPVHDRNRGISPPLTVKLPTAMQNRRQTVAPLHPPSACGRPSSLDGGTHTPSVTCILDVKLPPLLVDQSQIFWVALLTLVRI